MAIARALANEPKVLLADEPTGSLDSASTERFLDLLAHLGDTGMTVVMVTHDSEVAEHAHRTIEMCDGAIVSDRLHGRPTSRLGLPHSEHVRPGVRRLSPTMAANDRPQGMVRTADLVTSQLVGCRPEAGREIGVGDVD